MEERNYILYKHTSPSNKVYIGITKQTLKARWNNGHGYKNNDYFTKAITKYGKDNFKHEILYSNLTLDEAKKLEIETISFYDSTNRNKGYNITIGGDPCNKGLTEEQKREKRRKQANERNKTESRRKHRTEYMKKYRELNREKIRQINEKYRKNNQEKINKKARERRENNEKLYNID